jgi:GWxTD domain-containing protein
MKKIFALASFLLLLAPPLRPQKGLAPRYAEWLEDVSPIITKTEREIFSKLKTDADREKFIRFFWRQRDPFPDTTENEFYKEYIERIRFADQNFGHETSKRGSQTERGYHYLLLGPPLERQLFTTQSQIWPLELWFYKGDVQFGLPPYFYLIFFQPEGLGEYRLYSPGVDGPEKLVIPSMAPRSLTRASARDIIKQINAELAGAAMNYLPGDQSLGASPLSSNTVLASIRSLPEKKFSDSYARTYLSYKDYVETEYSDNFIESSFAARVFWEDGQPFIHWALEPKKINFVGRGDRFLAAFELVLRLEDQAGSLVLELTEEVPLNLTPEQYKAHERQLLAFQDIIPAVPGRYKVLGLLKNKSAQDFTSFSAPITVPDPAIEKQPSALLLYHSRERLSESQGRGLKAFTFGGIHYLVNARNEFPPQGEMGVFVQIQNFGPKTLLPSGVAQIEVRPADTETVVFSQKRNLSEVLTADGKSLDTGPFSLAELKPGYYSLELSIADETGRKLLTAKNNFVLLSQAYPVLPWVLAKGHSPFPNPEHLSMLGSEYFLTKQYDKAAEFAGRALQLKDAPPTRVLLGQILYALGRYKESLDCALPAYDGGKSRDAAKVIAADYAGLKDWTSALIYLERLLTEATEVSVLNLAGECHLNLNRPERALPLLQKSLEIDPQQPGIQLLLEKAKAGLKQSPSA